MNSAVFFLFISVCAFTTAAPRVYSVSDTVYFVQNESVGQSYSKIDQLLAEHAREDTSSRFEDTSSRFEDTSSRFEEVGDDEVPDVVGFAVESTSVKYRSTKSTEKPKSAEDTSDDSRFEEVGLDEITDVVGIPSCPYPSSTTPIKKINLIGKFTIFVSKITSKIREIFN